MGRNLLKGNSRLSADKEEIYPLPNVARIIISILTQPRCILTSRHREAALRRQDYQLAVQEGAPFGQPARCAPGGR